MALSVVATAKFTPTTSTLTRTVTVPSGVLAGDLIMLFISKPGGAAPASISGGISSALASAGESRYSGHTSQVYYKQNAQPADVGSVITVTTTTAVRVSVLLVVVRGVSTTGTVNIQSLFMGATGSGGTGQPGYTKTASTAVVDAPAGVIQFAAVTGTVALTSITAAGGVTLVDEIYDGGSDAGSSSLAVFMQAGPIAAATTIGGNEFTADGTTAGLWSIWTFGITLIAGAAPVNTVRPISLVSNTGGWGNIGGAASQVEALSDETDTTYIESPNLTSTAYPIVFKLGWLSTGLVTISERVYLSAAGAESLVTTLLQGTSTVIATWTDTITSTSVVDVAHTTTTAQAAAITDYANLHVRIEAV